MIDKLSGLIDNDDAAYLDSLIQQKEDVRLKWEILKETFMEGGPRNYLMQLDEEKAWDDFKEKIIEKKRRRIIRYKKWTIAASLLVPLIIACFIIIQKSNPKISASINIDTNRNVKLYVEGNYMVNLSENHLLSSDSVVDKIVNNTKLHIEKGTLRFETLKRNGPQLLNTLVVPETANYKIILSDQTEVWLNSLSRLKFPFVFSPTKREVWVSGEAYFKVTKNLHCPFVVHTKSTDINVVGTEFNVNTYDSNHVRTALVKGIVKSNLTNGISVQLAPGDLAVSSLGGDFQISKFERNIELSWLQGIYYFQNASLSQIANLVHRWYGDTLVFDDKEVSYNRFTGAMFKERPLAEFLENLYLTSRIRSVRVNGSIYLTEP